jgi:hypothetical protein
MYEGDVIHHLKATDLSYVLIAITFVSCFISLLERQVKQSVQIETAKRNAKFRGERKNEEIISRNCLPHHKRASSFTNTHKAAQLHFIPIFSRYSWMSGSVHHDEHRSSFHDRLCFCYNEQHSSLHAEGLICYEVSPANHESTMEGHPSCNLV